MIFRRHPYRFGYGAALRLVNLAVFLLAVAAVPAAAKPVRIVALGDSLTAGLGLAQADTFPTRLQDALRADGIDAMVVNAGVSGDTSAGGLRRLAWALAPGPDGPPTALIVELGANDGLRGLDPKATEANLDAILTRAQARGLKVLLTGMLAPPNLGRAYDAQFDAIYPRLAAKHKVLFYPFFLAGVAAVPSLNQADGIHPNPKGVAVIVKRILPYVKRLLSAP